MSAPSLSAESPFASAARVALALIRLNTAIDDLAQARKDARAGKIRRADLAEKFTAYQAAQREWEKAW